MSHTIHVFKKKKKKKKELTCVQARATNIFEACPHEAWRDTYSMHQQRPWTFGTRDQRRKSNLYSSLYSLLQMSVYYFRNLKKWKLAETGLKVTNRGKNQLWVSVDIWSSGGSSRSLLHSPRPGPFGTPKSAPCTLGHTCLPCCLTRLPACLPACGRGHLPTREEAGEHGGGALGAECPSSHLKPPT